MASRLPPKRRLPPRTSDVGPATWLQRLTDIGATVASSPQSTTVTLSTRIYTGTPPIQANTMDSAAKILASGSTSEDDLANSSDEDEHLIIVDVVGDCEDDVRTKERSTEVVPNRSAPTDEDGKRSGSTLCSYTPVCRYTECH